MEPLRLPGAPYFLASALLHDAAPIDQAGAQHSLSPITAGTVELARRSIRTQSSKPQKRLRIDWFRPGQQAIGEP
jgi:hypothetical protein